MLKRLGIGLLKGLVLGGALGAALHFGLGLGAVGAIGGFLIATLTGALAAVLSGRPPWQKGAWIESLLKGGAGLVLGAVVYWLASKFIGFGIPFALGSVPAGTAWTSMPLAIAPFVAAVFGGLVELDNTGDDSGAAAKGKKAAGAKVRVQGDDDTEEAEEPVAEAREGKRKKA